MAARRKVERRLLAEAVRVLQTDRRSQLLTRMQEARRQRLAKAAARSVMPESTVAEWCKPYLESINRLISGPHESHDLAFTCRASNILEWIGTHYVEETYLLEFITGNCAEALVGMAEAIREKTFTSASDTQRDALEDLRNLFPTVVSMMTYAEISDTIQACELEETRLRINGLSYASI